MGHPDKLGSLRNNLLRFLEAVSLLLSRGDVKLKGYNRESMSPFGVFTVIMLCC